MKVIFKNSSITFQTGAPAENITFTEGSGYVYNNGSLSATEKGHNSGLIPLEGVTKILAHVVLGDTGCVIAFFNADRISSNAFLSSVSVMGTGSTPTDYIVDNLAAARAAGATHFVVSYYSATGLREDFYAKYWIED